MQGRPEPGGESWERPSGKQPIASLNGTSKHRSIPQRPPGMPRVDQPPAKQRVSQPPATPRVARPKREEAQPKNFRKRLLMIGSLFLICAILACVGGFVATNVINGLNASSGAAATSSDFLTSLSKQDYSQAYKNLGAAITIQLSQDDFTKGAQSDDHCFGPITNYSEVPNSAKQQDNSQAYTYSITRSKLSKPYQLSLTLQQDTEGNSWKITDYGKSLGPDQQSSTCK
jgi:hypothetical protein